MQNQALQGRSAAANTRWLFGPVPDLVLGCGLGYAAIFVLLAAMGPTLVIYLPLGLLPILLMVTGGPHYGATLLRVYEHRESRRAYALFSVGATILLALTYVVSLRWYALGSIVLTLYLNWNPWHYAGQNYGLALMFLRRRGVTVTPGAKRLLYTSFLLSFVLAVIEMNGPMPDAIYAPVSAQIAPKTIGPVYQLISMGIPTGVQRILTTVGLTAYLLTTAAAGIALLRQGSLRDIGPSAALVATQSLWFVIPGAARIWGVFADLVPLGTKHFNYAFMWIVFGHAIQYLWITTFYAKKSDHFTGTGRHYLKCVLAGAAIWTVPVLLFAPSVLGTVAYSDGLYLLTLAVVNLHHFVLDGAIWKLRDSKIASILVRAPAGESAAPVAIGPPGRSWFKPVVYVAGAICCAVVVLGTWEREMGFRQASTRGDYPRMVRASERLTWIGQQESAIHRHLGAVSLRRGKLERGQREFERSLEIRNHPKAHYEIGEIYADREEWEQAARSYQAAYEIDSYPVGLIVRLADALIRSGRTDRARQVLNEGVARHPGQPLLVKLQEQVEAGVLPADPPGAV